MTFESFDVFMNRPNVAIQITTRTIRFGADQAFVVSPLLMNIFDVNKKSILEPVRFRTHGTLKIFHFFMHSFVVNTQSFNVR